ncbi:LytR/AlgR family response regulator transcription factor [Spirosoma pollinicola]|uniref:DNA-binding response regulator n=1 Tax=Spirosoma pollinicola TaxID=2057025 RepID=A0A2K8Z7K0_9BACT|nr:LytTR family DNA-binding domain-containing protein [Spirosoma pollinicola]AUD05830.1 DNA-binding response regulator [Spirosoma pollinicola]
MSIKTLLIDDEQHNLDNLRALLAAYCPQVDVCATARNAETAKSLLYLHHPDLLFLDIQMPGQSGFDLLSSLHNSNVGVIFVTAYDQYAIQALRFAAVDYLLKPVNIDELQAAVERAYRQHRLKEQHQLLQNLVHLVQAGHHQEEQRIALATAKETRFVKTSVIIRCESSNNYTTFYLAGGETLLVCKPIYAYDDLLTDYGFIRCHQSHLVNKKFIKSWKKEFGDFLLLTDGAELPISRGKKEDLKKALRL